MTSYKLPIEEAWEKMLVDSLEVKFLFPHLSTYHKNSIKSGGAGYFIVNDTMG